MVTLNGVQNIVPFDSLYRIVPKWEVFRSYPTCHVMSCQLLTLDVISGFRREVDKNCALLGYYAKSGGNFLPTFRDR
jgi:hypothetical protein